MNEDAAPRGPAPYRLPSYRKAVYALGDHTVNLGLSSVSLVFFLFLVKIAGLDPWLAGLLTWIARLVDAVTDPLMGRISDGTRWKLGRRRPYFLLGMVPFGLCYALLWRTPFDEPAAMFAYYLTVYIGLSLSMTVLSVPYMALIPEMASGYDERTSLNTFRSVAAIMGTMIAAVFTGVSDAFGGGPDGFAQTGLLLSVWLVLPWPFVFLASTEARSPWHADGSANGRVGRAHASQPRMGMLEGLRSLSRHRNYVRLASMYLASRIATDLLALSVPLFISDFMGQPKQIHWTLLSMLGVVVISLPFWLFFAKHLDKNRTFLIGAVWFVGTLVAISQVESSWPIERLFALAAMMGVGYAVVDLMPWAMLGEVIDEDELKTGERREGVYNGVFTFIRKLGGATAAMLAGFALTLAGYDKAATVQPPEALFTIRLITSVAPAFFLCLGICAAAGYPLGRKRHAEIVSELERRESQRMGDQKPPATMGSKPGDTTLLSD